jgi:SAM-dependent methyltransferase
MLNQLSDRRLALQPDIYQRYSYLARLIDILSGEGRRTLTLLDVGSGPLALTEVFVSPRFEIVRADLSQFDDPSIVLLHPGEPLPFENAAFDVAVAIDVLEHVPQAQRPSLIRELQRVSRQAAIVCCPVDTPEVVEAERQFSACAKAVSGRDVDFLVEHREHGLPDAVQVWSWFRDPGSVLVADNAPLDEWLAFNALDFVYACDLIDHDAKGRFAAAVNARSLLARVGAAHYRRFFCAFTSPAHAATAARMIDAAKSSPSDPQRLGASWSQASSAGARSCTSDPRAKSKRSTGVSVSWTPRSCASKRPSPRKMRTSGSSMTRSSSSRTQSVRRTLTSRSLISRDKRTGSSSRQSPR